MDAVSFLEYCTGCSIVLLSMGTMVKLVRVGSKSSRTEDSPSKPKWEPIPDSTADGLHGRLEAFQSARFASPIVQRSLSADAGPTRRDAIYPAAPMTVLQRPRPIQTPRQTVQTKSTAASKVVQIPLKQRPEDK
jgi:hypothetical protein